MSAFAAALRIDLYKNGIVDTRDELLLGAVLRAAMDLNRITTAS